MLSKNLTFTQVKAIMAERAGLSGMPSKKNLSNANAALGDFLQRLELSWTTPIGDTLRGSFEDLVGTYRKELQASGASPGHARNRPWQLRFWGRLVSALDHESAVAAKEPVPLTVAVRALFADGSRKPTPTAKEARISPGALKNWINGGLPARDQVPGLSRLEIICHMAPGYLTNLLPDRKPSRRSQKLARAPSTNIYRIRQKRLQEEPYVLPLLEMKANETLLKQWIGFLRDRLLATPRSKASRTAWTKDMADQLFKTPKKALENPWRMRPLKQGEIARWEDCLDEQRDPHSVKTALSSAHAVRLGLKACR